MSLLDGFSKIPRLAKAAREYDMPALAITDHGNMYGMIPFINACQAEGIKPIIGSEFYVAPSSRHEKSNATRKSYHLVLLARTKEGLRNLFALTTIANTEGFYYKPRIDRDLIARHHEGLICLSACLAGEVPSAIASDEYDQALATARWYRDLFGSDYYLELQRHNGPIFDRVLRQTLSIAQQLGIQVVATNDSHYVYPEDAPFHKLVLSIGVQKKAGESSLSFEGDDYALCSPDIMTSKFSDVPQALATTLEIADKIETIALSNDVEVPRVYDIPDDQAYLEQATLSGLEQRYGPLPQEYRERLDYELGIVKETGFARYILLVADICRYAREAGIRFGPRGSAAGSIICHALRISEPNPIEHGLLFERFLNPARIEVPDIDLDFADNRRGEIIEYLKDKYGYNHVASISSFSTLKPKQAVQDVARVTGLPYHFSQALSIAIGDAESLDAAIERPKVQEMMTDPAIAKVMEQARALEGLHRNKSTHAAGVVISARPLVECSPLEVNGKNDQLLQVQYEMNQLATAGLIKMDVLGVDFLAVLDRALALIATRHGQHIDPWQLPWDDQDTFDMLARGRTHGVFQLSSGGMRRVVVEMKPTSIQDLSALVALYRPGPLEHIGQYIAVKHGLMPAKSPHPLIDDIVHETNGVIIYQEQVLQIARKVAGYSYGQADILRKAIGKKNREMLLKQRSEFVGRAQTHSMLASREAEAIWEYFEPFARYGFNKCVAGTTRFYRQPNKHGWTPTIAEMYKARHDLQWAKAHDKHALRSKYRGRGYGKALSLSENNRLIQNDIIDIRFEGIRPVWRVTTESGATIDVTDNHKFPTPRGERQLSELTVGNDLYVNNGYELTATRYPFCHESASNLSVKGQMGFQKLEEAPSRDYELLREACQRTHKPCDICRAPHNGRFELHHYDGDHANGFLVNLVWLCNSCHKKAHYQMGRTHRFGKGLCTRLESIVSIEYLGEQEVYDVEMADPYHTFTVDSGIVTANSHAVCYGHLAYQTAYLKAHYPLEYMCALLCTVSDNQDKVVAGIAEATAMGIEVLPPLASKSAANFIIEESAIRMGVGQIKGIGHGIAQTVIDHAPYERAIDVVRQLCKHVTRAYLESLVKAGVFAPHKRSVLLANLDPWLKLFTKTKRADQMAMWDIEMGLPDVSDTPEAPLSDCLRWERDLTGVYLSDNPIRHAMQLYGATPLVEMEESETITVVGELGNVRVISTKADKAKLMCVGEITDTTGVMPIVVFPRDYMANSSPWQTGNLVAVEGRATTHENELQIVAHKITEVKDLFCEPEPVVPVPAYHLTASDIDSWLAAWDIVRTRPGPVRISLQIACNGTPMGPTLCGQIGVTAATELKQLGALKEVA